MGREPFINPILDPDFHPHKLHKVLFPVLASKGVVSSKVDKLRGVCMCVLGTMKVCLGDGMICGCVCPELKHSLITSLQLPSS